ncbi:heterokaryon incompatibility protein (HET) domain-containing protein [Pochonia chlamydosporia 170]|uniref:Heterokaryon incompatibility protein (HET) domain-containing protein n=1 Tax=Pochonia chlamydosporia 170 TaxID=1380566 RepID=A0A219AQ17_METCM|nr:heterokaryon incompatibility protein (HET) domain-containing protein [Pochonia chlamydosporia 170]OWT42893.1 heterokaryon incompatibility protein (HET) domain-containing protein [Pochonia chlamydosporia 170]
MAQLRYCYERALNPTKSEIRLLSILPGPPSSDIECTIEIASLCHSLPYACLSYTWGEPGDVAVITLNSLPFTVTKSLLTALHHLRNDQDVV